MTVKRRKSCLSKSIQEELIWYFVASTSAGSTAEVVGVNRNTAPLFFRKLREKIAARMEEETPFLDSKKSRLMRVTSAERARGREAEASQERCLYLAFSSGVAGFIL